MFPLPEKPVNWGWRLLLHAQAMDGRRPGGNAAGMCRRENDAVHPKSLQKRDRVTMSAANRFWLDSLSWGLRTWPRLLTIPLVGLLLALPFIISYADGSLPAMLTGGSWRLILLPMVMILYNVAIAPFFNNLDGRIAAELRPLSQLDDAEYDALVATADRFNPRAEWLAFGIGAAAQLTLFGPPDSAAPLDLYLFVAFVTMFGTMGWIIYRAIAGTRVSRTLPRSRLAVNLFDITPFEPIGRQSLLLAMAFVGAGTLSLFFAFSREDILRWQNIVIYGFQLLLTILIFFFNMWPTHRLLSRTRKEHIEQATRAVGAAYAELTTLRAQNADTVALESSLDTWMALEKRLKVTRTWPYNTEMLRALVITVLTPIAVALSRVAAVVFTSGRP